MPEKKKIRTATPRLPYHQYAESLPVPISPSGSHRLPESPICRVVNSPTHRCGEFLKSFQTKSPQVTDMESLRLTVSIRGVTDSPTHLHTAKTKNRNFETNIPRKGILGSQSQFPHSCVCERLIYSHDLSPYSAGGIM